MQLLRGDLEIVPADDGPGCQVRDGRSSKVYEFGAAECFLIECMTRPYEVEQVCAECNSRFGLQCTATDIGEFVSMLGEWGLLCEPDNADPAGGDVKAVDVGADRDDFSESATTADNFKQPNRWHLFNPQRLLDGLYRQLRPFRFMVWLVPVFFALGAIAVMFNLQALGSDFSRASSTLGRVGRLALGSVTVYLAAQIARGVVARGLGLATPSLGIRLVFGLIPRPNLQIATSSSMSRHTTLWLTATSPLLRLWLFGVAALLWTMTRSSGTFLSIIYLEVAFIAIFGLLFAANPLWPGDGARFVSAWLNIPNIHQRARGALLAFFIKQPAVIRRHSPHALALGLMGLASLALFLALLGFISYKVFTYLESRYHGAGVALFLLLAAYLSLNMRRQLEARKEQRAAASRGSLAKAATGGSARPATRLSGVRAKSLSSHVWLKYGLLLLFVAVLFLPYRYDASGSAEILPTARITLAVEMDGIVEVVNYKGGEWVKAGDILGQLADYKPLSDLRQTEAAIESMRFDIERYRTTPSAEEIKLAEEQLASAKLQAKYSKEKLQRQEQLVEQGFISPQALDDVRNLADHDRQAQIQAEASLESLKAQVNPNQIYSLQASLEKLRQEADYYREQLRRTRLRSPIDGQIVTKDLQFLRNSYLEAGKTFAQIENTRTVLLRVAVPESDIGDVEVGAPVTLRLLAYPDRDFEASVVEIQPATDVADFGRIVYVTSRANNPDGALKTGLTGQAKIQGKETRVLWAFTRALVRFVSVSAWSWLP